MKTYGILLTILGLYFICPTQAKAASISASLSHRHFQKALPSYQSESLEEGELTRWPTLTALPPHLPHFAPSLLVEPKSAGASPVLAQRSFWIYTGLSPPKISLIA